jgi:hypothetical protein
MSYEHIGLIVAAVIIVLIVWVPLGDFIGPPCRRFLERRRNQKDSNRSTLPAISFGTLAE